mgnify:CR=1 FL=1
MIKKFFLKYILIFLVFTTVACSGLNFSQLAPEAIDYHPQRIAVFPIEVWNHKDIDSRTVVEQIVAGSLVKKKLFVNVVDTENLQRQVLISAELKKAKEEYLAKLQQLGFSDANLSKKIGELLEVDAFLFLAVDEWKYTVKGDKKAAEVGLTMEMYDVATGKLVWKARHATVRDYLLIQPELPGLARDFVNKMIDYMPR